MKAQALVLKAAFVLVLAAVFAAIGYLAYPLIFEIVIGVSPEKAATIEDLKLEVIPVTIDMMAVWFAALGAVIGIGTLMCSVESTKKQSVFYFLFLLVFAIGFGVIWTYYMREQFTFLIGSGEKIDLMEFASFYEVPQFASVVVLVISLIVFIKKTKDH